MTGTKKVCYKETEIALMKQTLEEDHQLLLEIHHVIVGSETNQGLKGIAASNRKDIEHLQDANKIIVGAIVAIVVGVIIYVLTHLRV